MPEGPELFLSSKFVNFICENKTFAGKVVKSEVSKNPEIPWECDAYRITSVSRGKEVMFHLVKESNTLKENDTNDKTKRRKANKSASHCQCDYNHASACSSNTCLFIVFRFGMSGQFQFTNESETHKHSHLKFYTKDEPRKVLSFVDPRRFGRWTVGGGWSKDRGPCVLLEYPAFRENVLKHVSKPTFRKPICEVLLDQKYFNGIGNYLRAEILHRASIPPFTSACTVLEELADDTKVKVKQEKPDLLQLCSTLPMEVISLGSTSYSAGSGERQEDISTDDHTEFTHWLKCYYKPHMKSMLDHNRRTIWFSGPTGPLVPQELDAPTKKKVKKSTQQIKTASPEPGMASLKSETALPKSKTALPKSKTALPKTKTVLPEHKKKIKKEHTPLTDTRLGMEDTPSFDVKPTDALIPSDDATGTVNIDSQNTGGRKSARVTRQTLQKQNST